MIATLGCSNANSNVCTADCRVALCRLDRNTNKAKLLTGLI
jgi:hypothetical protein